MSLRLLALLSIVMITAPGCARNNLPTAPMRSASGGTAARAGAAVESGRVAAPAASMNGSAGLMPAYYDDHLFTINFMELPDAGERNVLAHNRSVNTIYMSDPGLPGGAPFVSVLDAIQGDGFNPLWLEVQIEFTEGHTARQLTSDTDVEAAALSGEIALIPTREIYRCSVVGRKR